MNIEQHYISLRKQYNTRKEGETFPILMEELQDTLHCTRRNAQLILKRMMDAEYLEWLPGKGRGNKSRLTFIIPLNQIILDRAKQLTKEEKLNEAWGLINLHRIVKFEFTEWLYRHFGFQNGDEKDVLRFPFYRPVPDLDPTFVNRRTEAHLVGQIFNTLVEFDEATKKVKPSLAHYWESNDNHTVWTFYLRKGVRFHHGKQLSADDIFFTFKRILHESSFEDVKSSLKNIRKVSLYTIEITLNEPNVLFINYLCSEKCSILPCDLDEIDNSQSFATIPIGTGPFRIKKNNDSLLVLEANDYYFQGRPHLDAIEMWIWPNFEQSKVIEKLEKQEIYFGEDQVIHEMDTKVQNIEQGATYISFNGRKSGPTQDLFFRKAVHLALNREKMIKELGEMRSKPSCSFFPDYSRHHFQNEFNIEHALSFLQKSIYKGEVLELYSYEMDSNLENAKWIQKELLKIGIHISITILPIKQLSCKEVLQKIDMVVAGEVLGIQPDISLIEMYTYSNGYIHNHLDNEQIANVKRVVDRCRLEEQFLTRVEMLSLLEGELKQSFNPIYLYHTKQTIQHSEAMQGIMLNAWGKVDYKNVWVKGKNSL